jgi:hypothetical protein
MGFKTVKEKFYLELGIFLLRYHLSMRRFMYLFHHLHRDKEEVIHKVYVTKKCQVNKGDWSRIVQGEKIKYEILETDDTHIMMPKQKFRKLVKTKSNLST